MRKKIVLFLVLAAVQLSCFADEGMWIPMLLKKYNIEDMQQKGFKLTAEDVYSINQAALKDAVVGLGRIGSPFSHFCTGEIVSNRGLILTNHHCAFDMIQAHTTLSKNYLKDGFWAKNGSEELVNPGITASILVRMEDVTDQVNAGLNDTMDEQKRSMQIQKTIKELEKEAVGDTNLQANIKPYFNGNQYFLSVYKIYKDIRLVGAPPSSIGKFGGDTDNWMWPRHTGDFAVLRIYANGNNEPATFSSDNKPYQPASFFKISTKGVQEGDFTMVFGYPAATNEYLTSFAIEQIAEIENPHKIAIRTAKLNIINAAMESDELQRIQYASKAANVANAWKKWQGERKGLAHFNTVENKQKQEAEFTRWANSNNKTAYSGLVSQYKALYDKREDLVLASAYLTEAGKRGAEIIGFASSVYKMAKQYGEAKDKADYKKQLASLAEEYYKDYNAGTDEKILAEMLSLYNTHLPTKWIPEAVFMAPEKSAAFSKALFHKSVFASQERFTKFIEKLTPDSYKKLGKDPAVTLANSMDSFYAEKINPGLSMTQKSLGKLNPLWMAGLMEMQPDKVFYPDANSTLRVSYGKIGGYSPVDAVQYKHYTTLKGIMQKDNPDIYDYNIPQKLRDIYQAKDFGEYTQDGEVPVCFIASNHTTGGNSGSPVLNAEGHLIGLNFDRAWDGVMSDMQYVPEICRNISVDIRYVLFIMDKLAGAGHLIGEMELVR